MMNPESRTEAKGSHVERDCPSQKQTIHGKSDKAVHFRRHKQSFKLITIYILRKEELLRMAKVPKPNQKIFSDKARSRDLPTS